MGIARRGIKGIWQHTRRVPKRYAHLEKRTLLRTSLHTQDRGLALAKASQIELLQDQEWEAAYQGMTAEPHIALERLQSIAQLRGFTYLPAESIVQLPLSQICDRIECADKAPKAVEAVLGTVSTPELSTKKWLGVYEGHISERLANKSPEQRKRWGNPRKRAIEHWHKAIGQSEVRLISRAQALQFRQWWRKRMDKEGLTANTANKDFAYLSAMWNILAKMEGWEEHNPFRSLNFAEEVVLRQAFSEDWIAHKLLASGALEGMNAEAADILRVMINTGARPSEITGLQEHHIKLDAPIPYIEIRAEGRSLKTHYSARDLPLVGVALQAMQRHPKGFPRYIDKTASWSGAVSKYLRENGLLEDPKQSPYCLRHSLSDRLQNQGCEDRTRKEIMGHRPESIIYGSGSTLAIKAEWLTKIGF